MFWQPEDRNVEDPEKIEYLPLGFDEFYGRDTGKKKEGILKRLVSAVEKAYKPVLDKLERWTEEQKQASELRMKLIEKELDLIEAEISLEETIEDMDEELKTREKEEEKKVEMGAEETKDTVPLAKEDEKVSVEELEGKEEADEEEDDDDGDGDGNGFDDDDDDDAPSSFGSASNNTDKNLSKNDQKGSKSRPSPFSTSSLSFATSSLVSGVSYITKFHDQMQSFLLFSRSKSSSVD